MSRDFADIAPLANLTSLTHLKLVKTSIDILSTKVQVTEKDDASHELNKVAFCLVSTGTVSYILLVLLNRAGTLSLNVSRVIMEVMQGKGEYCDNR